MGAVIVVAGGIAGSIFASAAYMAGFQALWVLAAYILGGYGMIALLFYRYLGVLGASGDGMNRRLEREMIALREWQDSESCREETEGQVTLFALLRNRANT